MNNLLKLKELNFFSNVVYSGDILMETIENVLNDTSLFDRLTEDFFLYKSIYETNVLTRLSTPPIKCLTREVIEKYRFNYNNFKHNDEFAKKMEKTIVASEDFIDLIRYTIGYYYMNTLFRIDRNKKIWNSFYKNNYCKTVENTYNKTKAININYFSEKPIEDCITSSLIEFIKSEEKDIEFEVEISRLSFCTIPIVRVVTNEGIRKKMSFNEVFSALYENFYKNFSFNVYESYETVDKKVNDKLNIITKKAIKEIFLKKMINDLNNPKNKNISKIINDISLCYVRNANYLNNYITTAIEKFRKAIKYNTSHYKFVNQLQINNIIERDENDAEKINFIIYDHNKYDRNIVSEKLSKTLAPFQILNTHINSIEPSITEISNNLDKRDFAKVIKWNTDQQESFDVEYINKLFEEYSLTIDKLNSNNTSSMNIYSILKQMQEISLKTDNNFIFDNGYCFHLTNLINSIISCYIGDISYSDEFGFVNNTWFIEYNERFNVYDIKNSFEDEYERRMSTFKTKHSTLFTKYKHGVVFDNLNEYIYAIMLDSELFPPIQETCRDELKNICDLIAKHISEQLKLIEEIKRIELKLLTEYTKYYNRVRTLAICLAKIDPFKNIKNNVIEHKAILNSNDIYDKF